MAKRNTRTTTPRSQANYTNAPASPVEPTDRQSESSPFGDSADHAPLVQDDADDPTRAVSMASEPPERSTTDPDEEQVRDRAYQRFLDRGGSHGYDVNDWIEAQEELRNRK